MPAESRLISTTKPCLNDPGWATEVTITIDVDRLIETRMLAEANSGGGKSYLLRRTLEQTYGKAQHIIIDVEGEFHTLRELYDYVLCAPRGGDCVADTRSAALLARRLLELGCSAIIDIYELGVQQAQFVKLFLESLMSAPRDLWHSVIVVVDEAHKFCPEKDQAVSQSAVIDLMTRGRKRGFCGVLATQRLSKLNKDAAAEANNLLIGRTSLDLDIARAATVLGMSLKDARATLPKLAPGEFFCVGPALSPTVERIHIGGVQTSHPKAGSRGAPPTPPRDKVRAILAKLADLPAEAEEEQKTMAELRAKVRDLESKLTSVKKIDDITVDTLVSGSNAAHSKILELKGEIEKLRGDIKRLQYERGESVAYANRLEKAYGQAVDDIDKVLEHQAQFKDSVLGKLTDIRNGYVATVEEHVAEYPTQKQGRVASANDAPTSRPPGKPAGGSIDSPQTGRKQRPSKTTVHPSIEEGARAGSERQRTDVTAGETAPSGSELPAVQRAILTVLAQWGPLPRRKILIYAGYSRSGSTDRAFAALFAIGALGAGGANTVTITSEGRELVGPVPPFDPVIKDFSDCESALLIVLETYGALSKADALMFAGYQRSGSTDRAWARLKANDWIEQIEGGVRITPDGSAALGPHEPALIGEAYREWVVQQCDPAAGKFFLLLCHRAGQYVAKADILALCKYKRSGSTDRAFAFLLSRGYAVKGGGTTIAVNPELFARDAMEKRSA